MARFKSRWAALVATLLWTGSAVLAYREGDFIPTARKSQFHGVRTQWHDLLGNHCPRFGQDRTVALPLPQPHAELEKGKDQYKIQLSFDGDRVITPWIKVLEGGSVKVPVLQVELRRAGDELLGVTAKLIEAPTSYLHTHAHLVDEFKNSSAWPKHLLIVYRFKSEQEVDLDRGLYVVIAIGMISLFVFLLSAASGSEAKLAQFLQDVVAAPEGMGFVAAAAGSSGSSAPAWKADTAKGE